MAVTAGGDIQPTILVLGEHEATEVALGADAVLRRRRSAQRVRLTRRPAPLTPLPPPLGDRLDREDEVAALAAAEGHVNVYGSAAIGKTYVLLAGLAGSGAAFVDARGRTLDDLLQAIADEGLAASVAVVLTEGRRRRELQPLELLVALDDVSLPAHEAERLLQEAPGCRFVLGSRRRLLPEAESLPVGGLPARAAVEIAASALGRPLEPDEAVAARQLAGTFEGHPVKLRQAAGTGVPLGELAETLEGDVELGRRLLRTIAADDRELLAMLAAAGGPLTADRIAELAERPDARERLPALRRRGLVQASGGRYGLAGALADVPPGDARRERAIARLVHWAERDDPALVLEESATLIGLLRWAAERDEHAAEALRLARALDRPLAIGRRWGSWARVLETARETAGRTGDVREEAWALHQLGTRAYALGDVAEGTALLEAALARRETLGDEAGAAVTRRNLEHIRGGAPAPRRGIRRLLGGTLAAAIVVAGVVLGAAALRDDGGSGARGDARAPVVEIASPRDGARVETGDVARYACRDDGTVAACTGAIRGRTVKSGAPLPAAKGRYTLTVRARDAAGNTARLSVTFRR